MANLNQFKLLTQKCESYFSFLEKELEKEIKVKKNSDKARFGFYLYILECITNIKDTNNLLELITDTDFNEQVFGERVDDNGIDAIYINEEDKEINLFNFKYREKFNSDSKHKKNDVFISTKFTNSIKISKTTSLDGILKDKADEIITHLYSQDIWRLKLYMVSNESNNLDMNDNNITELEELYDLEIIPISLDNITDFMSLRPDSINSTLLLNKDSILSYSEDDLTSTKSYIIKLSIPELIRITSDNKNIRSEYNLDNYSRLNDVNLNYGILFDNVRGYLGNTKYNKNIFETLKKEPNRFFMYNNGLTITTKNIDAQPTNGAKKMKFELEDIQVVNGGQTLRTLHYFKTIDNSNINDYLSESEILVRIFKTGNNPELTHKIAEYTNSQNAISSIDLKSIAHEQIQIEQFLEANDIIYARKIGDIGTNKNKEYKHKMSMEKFAQILFSIQGNPEKVSNQKKKIFDKYYDDVFGEENFNIENSAKIVNEYYKIEKIYKESTYTFTDQKIFYIFYLINHLDMEIEKLIIQFEKIIEEYKKDEELQPARKLIQKQFKDLLDQKLKIIKIY